MTTLDWNQGKDHASGVLEPVKRTITGENPSPVVGRWVMPERLAALRARTRRLATAETVAVKSVEVVLEHQDSSGSNTKCPSWATDSDMSELCLEQEFDDLCDACSDRRVGS